MRCLRSLACSMLLLVFFSATALHADFTARGRFLYQDLEIDLSGFTGRRPEKPIRLADVLILDQNTNTVLAQGATDLNGEFEVAVPDNQTRAIAILVVANSNNTPNLFQAVVVQTSTNRNGNTPHAFEGGVFANHSPSQDIAMGSAVARYHQGGEPFNTYDTILDCADFLQLVDGARPAQSIKTVINFDITRTDDFAYYNSNAGPGGGIFLGPDYGYDDTIILHELGHYIERNFGDFDDNPGDRHFIGDNAQNPLLSWGEGWATFWGSNVRLWRGDLHPNTYVNSVGDSTPGNLSFSYDLELRTGESASSENAVQSALWDMTDGPSTPDFTPGVDDEPGYQMTRAFSDTWLTASLAMSGLTEPQSLEDFFDTWNLGVSNPQTETLRQMFFGNHNVQFFPDAFEGDNTQTQAVRLSFAQVGSGAATHHTHYPQGDEDWLAFDAFASVKYSISTNTMRDGADTYLSVHDAESVELAANDNVGTPQAGQNNAFEVLRSDVQFQPAQNGPLFIRSRRSPSNSNVKYGHYNLVIAAVTVGPEAPNLQLSTAAITVSARRGETRERNLLITNTGTQDTLVYALQEQLRNFTVFDFPWLTPSRLAGTLAPGKADTVTLFFDSDSASLGQNIARLEVQSNDPNNSIRPVAVVLTVTQTSAVDEQLAPLALPTAFSLGQSYPNPFSLAHGAASARIAKVAYDIPAHGRSAVWVTLRVYDILGRAVRTLVNQTMAPGAHETRWDGRDESGALVGNGLYFYKIAAADYVAVRKLTVVR